jgi:hypothetical protein
METTEDIRAAIHWKAHWDEEGRAESPTAVKID